MHFVAVNTDRYNLSLKRRMAMVMLVKVTRVRRR